MKKIHLLATLAFAIVAAGVMLSSANAANNNLTLQITAAGGTGCTGGQDLDLGTTPSSYSAQADTGTIGGNFICTGNSATASTFTIQATTKPVHATTVAVSDVLAKVGSITTAWDALCLASITLTGDFGSIVSTPQNILNRSNAGYPCTLTTTVQVAVAIPANAPTWAYTGVLAIVDWGNW